MVSPALSTLFDALPVKLAVMVPAEKLPDESRVTIAFAVLAFVAVVAELATLPAVEMVASFESVIAAVALMSLLTISELDKLPEELLCTMPGVVNASIEIVPPEDIFNCSAPLVLKDKLPLLAESPLVVLPVNISDGNAVVPAGSCNAPVIVSPALSTLFDALPVKLAIIVLAEKLPDASRATIVLGVSRLVAAFAKTVAAATFVAVCPPTVLTTDALCVPVTSPVNEPEKLVAVVAVVALPLKLAVMVPAEKLPDASRFTMALAALRFVAALARTAPAATFEAVCPPTVLTTVALCVPVTSPVSEPEKLVAVVAVVALPLRLAVIVLAEKLPEASRFTIALALSRFVAALARTAPEATFAAVCPPTVLTTVAPCVPVTSPSKDPEKLVAVVAVVALPLKLAVIVPAEKLPDGSRETIALAVLRFVAVVAEFATFPEELMVFSLESVIAALLLISLLTISELDKFPEESLWTIPATANASIEIVPPEDIFNCSAPLVLKDKLPVLAERPLVVLPVNTNDGNAVVPAGNCSAPVIVSPALSTLFDALPVRLAMIVLAEKLPDASRATIVFGVLRLVAVVAELATLPAVLMVFNLVSTIPADADTSAFTINDVDKSPAALLCTTPVVLNPSMVTPLELIFICSTPLVSKESILVVGADMPVPVLLPVN